jgi:dethiobiotin synthetase
MQKGEISDDLVNPFYFRPPVAPLVAARKSRKKVRIDDILDRISHVRERTEWLIVEGAGGLLSPLGEDFSALDLISAIKSQVCVVAPNKLGVINHVRLTLAALESRGGALTKVLLTDRGLSADASRATNLALLAELLPGTPILRLPWLGPRASTANRIERNRARTRTLMEQVLS